MRSIKFQIGFCSFTGIVVFVFLWPTYPIHVNVINMIILQWNWFAVSGFQQHCKLFCMAAYVVDICGDFRFNRILISYSLKKQMEKEICPSFTSCRYQRLNSNLAMKVTNKWGRSSSWSINDFSIVCLHVHLMMMTFIAKHIHVELQSE